MSVNICVNMSANIYVKTCISFVNMSVNLYVKMSKHDCKQLFKGVLESDRKILPGVQLKISFKLHTDNLFHVCVHMISNIWLIFG
jgi:hypothetical protein